MVALAKRLETTEVQHPPFRRAPTVVVEDFAAAVGSPTIERRDWQDQLATKVEDRPLLVGKCKEVLDRLITAYVNQDLELLNPTERAIVEENIRILTDPNAPPFEISLVETDTVNAEIFVDQRMIHARLGLLRASLESGEFANWDSVASTIAHEIGHVLYRNRRDFKNNEQESRKNSHDMENECDRIAPIMMELAGFNPRFAGMGVFEPNQEERNYGARSFHPSTYKRHETVQAQVRQGYWKNYGDLPTEPFSDAETAEIRKDTEIESLIERLDPDLGSSTAGKVILAGRHMIRYQAEVNLHELKEMSDCDRAHGHPTLAMNCYRACLHPTAAAPAICPPWIVELYGEMVNGTKYEQECLEVLEQDATAAGLPWNEAKAKEALQQAFYLVATKPARDWDTSDRSRVPQFEELGTLDSDRTRWSQVDAFDSQAMPKHGAEAFAGLDANAPLDYLLIEALRMRTLPKDGDHATNLTLEQAVEGLREIGAFVKYSSEHVDKNRTSGKRSRETHNGGINDLKNNVGEVIEAVLAQEHERPLTREKAEEVAEILVYGVTSLHFFLARQNFSNWIAANEETFAEVLADWIRADNQEFVKDFFRTMKDEQKHSVAVAVCKQLGKEALPFVAENKWVGTILTGKAIVEAAGMSEVVHYLLNGSDKEFSCAVRAIAWTHETFTVEDAQLLSELSDELIASARASTFEGSGDTSRILGYYLGVAHVKHVGDSALTLDDVKKIAALGYPPPSYKKESESLSYRFDELVSEMGTDERLGVAREVIDLYSRALKPGSDYWLPQYLHASLFYAQGTVPVRNYGVTYSPTGDAVAFYENTARVRTYVAVHNERAITIPGPGRNLPNDSDYEHERGDRRAFERYENLPKEDLLRLLRVGTHFDKIASTETLIARATSANGWTEEALKSLRADLKATHADETTVCLLPTKTTAPPLSRAVARASERYDRGPHVTLDDLISLKYITQRGWDFLASVPPSDAFAWITKNIPDPSPTRDALLNETFAKRFEHLTLQEKLQVLDLYFHEERSRVLQADTLKQHLNENRSFDDQIDLITKTMKTASRTRDAFFEQVLSDHPIDKKRFSLVAQLFYENARVEMRQKSIFDGTLSAGLENLEARQKVQLVEWLMRKHDAKPEVVDRAESVLGCRLDELRDGMADPEFRREMIATLFSGSYGLFTESHRPQMIAFLKNFTGGVLDENASDSRHMSGVKKVAGSILEGIFSLERSIKKEKVLTALMDLYIQTEGKPTMEQLLTATLSAYGLVGIKLGQILASNPVVRRELPDLFAALEGLKNQVNPMLVSEAFRAIYREPDLRDTEVVITKRLASASIKGVFDALIDDEEKILKVRRVDADKEMPEEEKELRTLLKHVEPALRSAFDVTHIPDYAPRIMRMARREIDFPAEVASTVQLKKDLEAIESNAGVSFTAPQSDTKRTLLYTIIESKARGAPLDDYLKTVSKGRAAAVEGQLQRMIVLQADGKIVHLDLHTKNAFGEKQGNGTVVTVIDCGMCAVLTEPTWKLLKGLGMSGVPPLNSTKYLKALLHEHYPSLDSDALASLAKTLLDTPVLDRALILIHELEASYGVTPADDLYEATVGASKTPWMFEVYRANIPDYVKNFGGSYLRAVWKMLTTSA